MKQINSRGHWIKLSSKAKKNQAFAEDVVIFTIKICVFVKKCHVQAPSRYKMRWIWGEDSVRSCGPESGLLQALHIWFLLCCSCYALWDVDAGPRSSSCSTFSCCIWQHKAHNLFVSHCNREKWILQIALQCFRELIMCGCANANGAQVFYSPSYALMWYCIELSLYLKVITFFLYSSCKLFVNFCAFVMSSDYFGEIELI